MKESEIDQSKEFINDTLTTFLTSSLNVELVHVILKSIIRSSGKAKMYGEYTPHDFYKTKKHLIDSIKISNPEKWQVSDIPQELKHKEEGK